MERHIQFGFRVRSGAEVDLYFAVDPPFEEAGDILTLEAVEADLRSRYGHWFKQRFNPEVRDSLSAVVRHNVRIAFPNAVVNYKGVSVGMPAVRE